jgi:CBS domain-containing protein
MRVDEVMTTGVATVRADAFIGDAIATMEARHVSGLPVVDGSGALVGMLTEGDLLKRVETGTAGHQRAGWLDVVLGSGRGASEYVHTHSRYVEDLMSRELVTATESTSLEDVVALMAKRHVKRLPIVRDAQLVGILSRADLVRALGRALKAEAAGGSADDLIHERLQADLKQQSWFQPGDVSFSVKGGVVTFKGVFSDHQVRDALRVAAQNMPGVTAVEDELEWIDPVVGVVF